MERKKGCRKGRRMGKKELIYIIYKYKFPMMTVIIMYVKHALIKNIN